MTPQHLDELYGRRYAILLYQGHSHDGLVEIAYLPDWGLSEKGWPTVMAVADDIPTVLEKLEQRKREQIWRYFEEDRPIPEPSKGPWEEQK